MQRPADRPAAGQLRPSRASSESLLSRRGKHGSGISPRGRRGRRFDIGHVTGIGDRRVLPERPFGGHRPGTAAKRWPALSSADGRLSPFPLCASQLAIVGRLPGRVEQARLGGGKLIEISLGKLAVLAELVGPHVGHLPFHGVADDFGIGLEPVDCQQPIVVGRADLSARFPTSGDKDLNAADMIGLRGGGLLASRGRKR